MTPAQRVKKLIWSILLTKMGFNWKLNSNVSIQIRNYGDWVIYNEIFVDQEYDKAIQTAIEAQLSHEDPFQVIDLGANVGFFSLRFCDQAIKAGINPSRIRLLAVEADGRCLETLPRRLNCLTELGVHLKAVQGLVGKRSGTANFSMGREAFSSNVSDATGDGTTKMNDSMAYIDVEKQLDHDYQIALIKCDIEGSEFDFIPNYSSLLEKTKYFAIEYHLKNGSIADAESILAANGLKQPKLLSDSELYPTYFYTST